KSRSLLRRLSSNSRLHLSLAAAGKERARLSFLNLDNTQASVRCSIRHGSKRETLARKVKPQTWRRIHGRTTKFSLAPNTSPRARNSWAFGYKEPGRPAGLIAPSHHGQRLLLVVSGTPSHEC
ncbi:hypothetical protein CLAIMM_01042 isoform 3, partial [Cladophialophora immunda]